MVNYEAFVHINRVSEIDEWAVKAFNDNHHHSMMTPTKQQYLCTNQVIPHQSQELFKALKDCNIPSSKQFAIASLDCYGYECMTFSDFNNMNRDERTIVLE